MITDNGKAFSSAEFKEFVDKDGIDHSHTAVSTARANGQVERYNRVIVPMIAKMSEIPEKWDEIIEKAEFALNNTVCRTTEETPSRLLFGINQVGEIDDIIKLLLSENESENIEKDLEKIRSKASGRIKKSQQEN